MQYRKALMFVAIASVMLVGADVDAGDLPNVPGFRVGVFAELCEPGGISFGASGELFAGSGGCQAGNGGPAWIRRISPDGFITNYGEDRVDDPDLVLVDTQGFILEAGTILVGSSPNIEAILPDEAIVTAVAAGSNVYSMAFDSLGRLYFTNLNNGDVLVSTGGTAKTLYTVPSTNITLAVDDQDRIFTLACDGILRIYDTDGNVIDDAFVTGLGCVGRMAFGPGGAFGDDLYLAASETELLYRIDRSGNAEVVGSNLGVNVSVAFGPDGAFYVSQCEDDLIVRISPCPDLNGDELVDPSDLLVLLAAWGACGDCNECPPDLNQDCQVGSADLITLLGAWGPCPK